MTKYHCHRRDHQDMILLQHSLGLGNLVIFAPSVAKVWGRTPDLPRPQARILAVGPVPLVEHP